MTTEPSLDEWDLRQLIRTFVASNVRQLSLDLGYLRIDIDKHVPRALSSTFDDVEPVVPSLPAASADTAAATVDVRAPGVGILRWPPDGGRDTPLDVGGHVEADEEICSLEALGNRLPVVAPRAGIVLEICVEDGDFVEYGCVILRLRPAS